MSTHLPTSDDRPASDTAHDDRQEGAFSSDFADYESYESYRAVSWSAIAALTMAIFSLFGFIFVPPLVIGLAAMIVALYSLLVITSRSDELTGAPMAIAALALSGFSLFVGGGLHAYVYLTEVPDGYTRISFADLQPDSTGALPPEQALALDGRQVFIKGYVLPGDRADNIKQFILVPDFGSCCFGGQPKITDMVDVTLLDHPGVSYGYRRRGLAGTFHVEKSPTTATDGQGVIYRLEAEHVR